MAAKMQQASDDLIGPAADQGLLQLGRYLIEADYRFTTITPLSHAYNNQRPQNAALCGLRDIFGWSREFERTAVKEHEFELMKRAGILLRQGERWQSRVRWSRLDELLCVHSAYPTEAEDAVFFGPDTYRFAQFIEPHLWANSAKVKRAVDIGCGSGAGALLVAKACPEAEVLAVDINSQALRFSSINAQLAGLNNMVLAHSNLLTAVEGDFDLIIANPPYMLDTQQRAYRHGGGEFGEALSVRIVQTALQRLAPGGTLLLYTGVAMSGGRDPFFQAVQPMLDGEPRRWRYRELDPDVFGEELSKPAYADVERIAAVALTLTLNE